MIEVSEALARVLATTPLPIAEELPLAEAVGRFAMEAIRARVPLPGFDQSSMDGYALRSEDVVAGGEVLRVIGVEAAGATASTVVGRGEAVRVFTGAQLPAGADAVVMQEDVEVCGETVRIAEPVRCGEFVRRAGEVVCRGQLLVDRGCRLGAAQLGLIASQGLATVSVGRAPVVGIVTTGDELVDPGGGDLQAGQIFNSNATMLEAALRTMGIGSVRRWHVGDDFDETVAVLGEALQWADVLLVAGGVSVGDRDFVKPALAACGVEQIFWGVRMKPGKPLLYAVAGETQVFGLPGNPVSALVGFEVFVLSALLKRMGAGEWEGRKVPVRLAEDVVNRGDRPQYLRGSIDGQGWFSETTQQGSHGLLGLAEANALLWVEVGARLSRGDLAMVLPLS